jgi:transketolase
MPASIPSLPALRNVATRLRIDSVRSTSEAGSGHPTSCLSAAEIVAALFFGEMHYDPADPGNPDNDRFVLSKGHAAPVLYAAWAEAGHVSRDELLTLRQLDSDLEGHPTPRLPFVDVATGSLGQGICAALGIALDARRVGSPHRTYVLLGDGESAEGSVWEAASAAAHFRLDSLCGIVDVNALGQSGPTQFQHATDQLARRWEAFGWETMVVDGHDLAALLDAFARARLTPGRPTMILAKTLKGKGISWLEGRDGWHGKPLKKGDELRRALDELEAQLVETADRPDIPRPTVRPRRTPEFDPSRMPAPTYQAGKDQVATREAFGTALAALGGLDSRVVALDADVKNSTFSEKFEAAHPERFYQFFIAEQAMVGAALGFGSRGAIPFASTFACFLTRAYDFIRMGGVSFANVKLTGSHAGVSIGEDGPSQMALEDLAMMRSVPHCVVLYPCDGVSTERLVVAAAVHQGMTYMRTSRPKTPVIYGPADRFEIGGSKVLRQSDDDVATVVAAGITVFEALKAHEHLEQDGIPVRVIDLYSVQPVDRATLLRCGRETGMLLTVEDHYAAGGIGDAVSAAVGDAGIPVYRLAVPEVPRSGRPEELLDKYGISARHIVDAVRRHGSQTREPRGKTATV